ncbi:GGDEF domain-containing protein [Sulfuricurvum sp.]|uniref:GGDEF domain-containing protein n=1 Tax=Sulfuricurvum sp. TaxID=2025608 RepID=UPI002E353BDC|nr:GGDEF domain-containing protein [Sulfuricurvum sp.]HEX5330505.1 GGDEF domain-containing protein [Sulfuricurvum sp.]
MAPESKNGDFTIFDNEERVIKQAEELATSFDAHAKLVHDNMKSLAQGYRRSFREQQRLIRLSDRQQEQLRHMTVELQDANERLEEQAQKLEGLNSALQEEIAQKKILEAELRAIAMIDSLTGVYTRRQLLEFGNNELKRFLRKEHALSLLILDIDHFKKINDTYGHSVGDSALKHFSEVCKNSLRTTDIIGRIGGEEFVIIMPDTEVDEGYSVAERVRMNVAEAPFLIGDAEGAFALTVSIGLYQFTKNDHSFEHALSKADSALYEAKGAGRNNVTIFKEGF